MNLSEATKPTIKKTIVIYSGRFQPFHKGHYAAYQRLVSKFGADNVYIGTSDKTDTGKSPFNFNDKKKIATTMFGVPSNKFVQLKNPYSPVEILSKYDGKTTQYIAAVGEKDASRLAGKYFKPYRDKAGYGYDEIGYTYIIPSESNPISGTDVRNGLGSDDETKAKEFFLKAYPKFDKGIYKMITTKLNEEGFPGGIGVGLNLPNGYINGAPTGSTSEIYDPISEILASAVTEDMFENWLSEYLSEEPNPIMDKEITYTSKDGKKKKITVRGALRLPKDHEAHIQASKLVGPDDAPANEPKQKKPETPSQPGQPVKKGDTQQGKVDNQSNTNNQQNQQQGPPPEQKLSGAELKSSAEQSPNEKRAEHMKQVLDDARKKLSDEENQMIDNVNNPESNERKGMMNNIKSGIQKFGKGLKHWVDHKKEMVGGTMDAVKALANGQKIGSIKNKETGKWEYSDEVRKEQIHHIKHFAIDAGLILGSMALGGAGVAGVKAVIAGKGASAASSAAIHGATGAFTHGAVGFGTHLAKDIAKHASLEALGLGATHAAGAGAALSTATMGLLEVVDDTQSNSFIGNFMKKAISIMETYKMTDEQLVNSIKEYKKEEPKQNAADLLKEEISESKKNSINDFVEYATKRLKLQEKPKVTLISGNEYSESQSSLGGYSPETKEIYVQIENRLGADILRTIAHEMVHRKQDELGLIGDPIEAGKDGSPVENQAHAVAGILMREYGRKNKQIYQEGKNSFLNEAQAVSGGKVHKFITGKNLGFRGKKYSEIEFETLGIDNRNQTVRLKIIAPKEIGGNEMSLDFRTIRRGPFFKTDTRSHSIKEELLTEGGAYGHMNHPFDISMNLTFGDLKKIINNALDGNLGVVREKTDGQALAISWKNGRLIAARNKSHLANGGANALDANGLASKFGGRGALSDAYNFAMRDLSAAISSLGEAERKSIFKDGSAFCNLEVIYPQNANVIPYGQNLLVFHNVVEYDEKGNAIGGVKGAESKLASMIKKVNADVQSKYTIQGPPITRLPKDEKLSSQKGKFGGMLSRLQSEFGLSDKDGVAEYHYAWWMNFVNKSKKKLSQLEKEGLARRWAFDNKSFTIKSITDEDARKWADGVDKDAKDKIMKGNLRKFEDIFLGVGAEVLSFMSSVLTAQPDSALQSIKSSLESTISAIKSGGSETQIKRLEKELARLNAIGGFDKLVPNEGLVFFYKGNTYKLTGTFAPLNQILGIFKFGR